MYFKNKQKNKKKKKNNKTKKTKILTIKAGFDTFNRFHSPVIVHRKHEGAVTRHEFLPSSARKHLQLSGGCCPADPLLTGSFFLATPLNTVHEN